MAFLEREKLRHPDDELVEQYALHLLATEAIPRFEQHVLICHACQDRLAQIDADVQGIRAEARHIRTQDGRRRGTTGYTGRN